MAGEARGEVGSPVQSQADVVLGLEGCSVSRNSRSFPRHVFYMSGQRVVSFPRFHHLGCPFLQQPIPKNTVSVLVATAHRTNLLECRSLLSIEHQSRQPARVVVVDDSGDDAAAERTERLVRGWQPAGIDTDFLRNRRTKGAAGAWNSGLDHLLRMCGDSKRLYVVILDGADQWDPHHLERCLTTAESFDLDMVAAQFWRIEENAEPRLVVPPRSLDIASFLAGNPGIQASNLVCRLSVLLEAGLFDESLQSCTDRDLCIRIAELPGVRYGITSEPTVHHFACNSRPRSSSPGSPSKTDGLDRFFRKYCGRMSGAERTEFRMRANGLFGWEESALESAVTSTVRRGSPLSLTSAPLQDSTHLIVGMIADTAQLENASNLLADLRGLAENPGLSGHDVLIVENGCGRMPNAALRCLVESERKHGLRVHLVDRARHVRDAANGMVIDSGASRGRKLPIAPARTVLQSYLYAFAKDRSGAVVWIVDDDMRLDPLVIEKDGRLQRRAWALAPVLRELRRLRAGGAIDVAIGICTGAPPVPFAATVRVQLVDLVASLWWLASQDPQAALPDRGVENAEQRSGRRDYYYDLSRNETDRLETPFWITPTFPGERVGEAFERVVGAAERILAGEQVFRPLAVDASIDPLEAIGDGLQRGGNTFVLDIETLRLAPNPSPIIDGRPSRRSDMVWALMQKQYFGKRVVTVPIALYHDRSRVPVGKLDVERIVDDIRGYAMFSALKDIPDVFTATDDHRITLAEGKIDHFAGRVHKYLEERLAVFHLSFYRILGLIRVLRRLVDNEEIWWQREEYRASRERLRRFCDLLAHSYEDRVLDHIKRKAGVRNALQIREFLEQLPVEIELHRNRTLKSSASAQTLKE